MDNSSKEIQGNDANAVLAEGFLLSMTDFIDKYLHTGDAVLQIRVLQGYKDFLKQILKLEMFVPCDNGSNILERPIHKYLTREGSEKEFDDYSSIFQLAKNKVLFSNVEVYTNWKYNLYFLSKIEFAKYDFKTKEFVINYPFDTVESIIGLRPKLTQSALSAIFG